jgi:hypothetical protein
VLGFTIDSGGLPFYEVLLTIDKTLFDPANAARRTADAFYSSRQEGGLRRADASTAIYIVPTAVLRNLSKAREIFYTAVTYSSQDATDPIFAQDPSSLVTQAPSVSVAPGFQGSTLAAVLSVPLERLCRHSSNGNGHGGLKQEEESESLAAPEVVIDRAADLAEGEDGYGLSDTVSTGSSYNDDYDSQEFSSAASEDDDYNDGFSGPIEESTSYGADDDAIEDYGDVATAQESTFPQGSQAPEMLEDIEYDEENEKSEHDDEHSYHDGYESAASAALDDKLAVTARPFDIKSRIALIAAAGRFESGPDGYAAINADGEFQGKFPGHPAQGKYHNGLSYGIVQFSQDSGNLGRLLLMMRERAPEKFKQVFGPDSDELIHITNLSGPPSSQAPNGRSARVQPIGGADLWEPVWLARFREAANKDLFEAGRQLFNGAQNELASITYLDPMLPFAAWMGMNTERALGVILDRSIQMGPAAARRWITEAAGPIQTPAQRQQALASLGYTDIHSFQQATLGLEVTGEWDSNTHAALVAALRSLPAGRSPVPIMTLEEMMQSIIRRAAGTPWESRTRELISSLSDAPYQI